MVSAAIAGDGFEWILKSETFPGEWQTDAADQVGADNGRQEIGRQIIVGQADFPDKIYMGAIKIGPLAIAPGGRVTSFRIFFKPDKYYSDLDWRFRAIADPSVELGYDVLPSQQVLTQESSFYSTSSLSGYTFDAAWDGDPGGFGPKIQNIANEVLAHPNWVSGGYIWVVMIPIPRDNGDGWMIFKSLENAAGVSNTASYTETVQPVITSISGDDSVKIGEIGVEIIGTDLLYTSSIRVYNNQFGTLQNVISKSDTLVTFNLTGSFALGSYTLELTSGGLVTSRSITITDVNGNITGGIGQAGSALCDVDGHEYDSIAGAFPGTWESVASSASNTQFWPEQVITGTFSGNIFKTSLRIGPINQGQNQKFSYVRLNLPIQQCYARTDFVIKAVADPDVFIGVGNIITGKTLTTAEVVVSNSTWVNYNPSGYWTPAENPKVIDVTDIVEEVMSHANWAPDKYVTMILGFTSSGSESGITGVTSDESTSPSSTLSWLTTSGPVITSVSGDDVVSLGELNVGIVGSDLTGATNLNISKGVISEDQTITLNNGSLITFDLSGGTLVDDTGYTLSFDVDGTTYSTTIDIGATPGGTTISSVSGNNRIRHEQTNVKISGTVLDSIGAIQVFQGLITEEYPIKTIAANQLTFDFYRGRLKCGNATLRIIEGVSNTDVAIRIEPIEGSTWVDIADSTNKDDSLLFNADPPFEVGDQIIYTQFSDQGFRLNVSTGGVVVLEDARATDQDMTFRAESYHSSQATWYEEELITYKPSGFSAANTLGGVSFFSTGRPLDAQTIADFGDPNGGDGGDDGGGDDGQGGGDQGGGGDSGGGGPVVTPGGTAEVWTKVEKPTAGEEWQSVR